MTADMTRAEPLYRPCSHRPMHVAVFGSGSGTILRAMLAAQKESERLYGKSPFAIKLLFTDRESRFSQIAKEEKLPLIQHPFSSFIKDKHASNPCNPELRKEYDQQGVKKLFSLMEKEALSIDFLLLAGYMRILSSCWLEAFPYRILNVHPADLTHLDPRGRRKFVGDQAVLQALQNGQEKTRSTVIVIDEKADTGPIVVSGPWVEYREGYPITKESAIAHQERQKAISDWPACLCALQLISQGRVKILPGTDSLFIDDVEQQHVHSHELVSASFKHDAQGVLCVESLGSLGKSAFQH